MLLKTIPNQILSLKIRTSSGKICISINNIVYIKADNKTSTLYTKDMIIIKTNHLLKWYQEVLPEPFFIRCHHSYIINSLYVNYWNGNLINLQGNIKIPLSRSRINMFETMIMHFQTFR